MIVIVLLCCEIDFQVARLQFCGVLLEAGDVMIYIRIIVFVFFVWFFLVGLLNFVFEFFCVVVV